MLHLVYTSSTYADNLTFFLPFAGLHLHHRRQGHGRAARAPILFQRQTQEFHTGNILVHS